MAGAVTIGEAPATEFEFELERTAGALRLDGRRVSRAALLGRCMGVRAGAGAAVRRDAEAITEAAQRPTMHFVAVKTEAQQAQGMFFRTRDLLVRQRTQTINALRGHLGVCAAEAQLTEPNGHRSVCGKADPGDGRFRTCVCDGPGERNGCVGGARELREPSRPRMRVNPRPVMPHEGCAAASR